MNLLNTKAATYAAVAIVGVVALYIVAKKLGGALGDAADAVGNAINPTSDTNLAYRATNGVGSALTGDQDFTLGGWFYDLTHEEYNPNPPPPANAQTTGKQKAVDTWWAQFTDIFTPGS